MAVKAGRRGRGSGFPYPPPLPAVAVRHGVARWLMSVRALHTMMIGVRVHRTMMGGRAHRTVMMPWLGERGRASRQQRQQHPLQSTAATAGWGAAAAVAAGCWPAGGVPLAPVSDRSSIHLGSSTLSSARG